MRTLRDADDVTDDAGKMQRDTVLTQRETFCKKKHSVLIQYYKIVDK